MRENCPLLFDVLDTLFLHKEDGRPVSENRVKSAVHALSLLVSLKSQKIKNDFKIIFTCLCISFGAGTRFVTMLNKLGLTVSWDKAMAFLDFRKVKQQDEIKKLTPLEKPVILMFDNVNMYRGKHKHLRLFKSAGPVMWNFTVQAVLVPDITDLEEIFHDDSACLSPQKSILEMDPNEIFIEADQEKRELFEQVTDMFLLELLDTALNKIPESSRKLKNMTESQVNAYLAKANYETTAKYSINVPKLDEIVTHIPAPSKSEVHILPLSLENNSTIVGTMSILDQLATDFSLPNNKKGTEYVPFDSLSKTWDIKLARSHYELILSQRNHKKSMRLFENQLCSQDKELTSRSEHDSDEDNLSVPEFADIAASTTLESERRHFESEDKPFWDTYNLFCSKLVGISAENSVESYLHFVNGCNKADLAVRDHLGRTLLHAAVELGQENLLKCLVDMGININSKEGCGITPLSLAVLHKKAVMSKFLVESGAKYCGPLFTSIPSPLCMAETLKLEEIEKLFSEDHELSEEEDELIRQIGGLAVADEDTCSSAPNTVKNRKGINRSCHGFATPVVGDVGTCKTNSAAMARSSAYRWVGICPGDLHNKGYYCEAVFKVHGSNGLHYILLEVMKRKKLIVNAFKKKKFQDGNLLHIREAIRDVCKAYGLAAVLEFLESSHFPPESELIGNNSTLLILTKFKEWISESSASDLAFEHRASTFLLYGPIQMLYDAATAYSDGFAREIVYQLLIPIYTQLGFSNYSTEVFRHVVNFLAKWPLATRRLLQNNCSVNLSGIEGRGIELDAFVESEVVQPLKTYTTGHTTVTMCKRLMGNIDLLKFVRKTYMGKEGFDMHNTSRHSEQSPFPDQIKGAWFCLQRGFFVNAKRKEVECYPVDKKGEAVGKVPQNLLDIVKKGKSKISKQFKAKLYESFPDLRYDILS